MSSLLVQGILFDLDGVLIDSTAGVTRVWRDWGIRHGLDPDQTAHTAHGRRAIDTVRLLAPQLDAEAELAISSAAKSPIPMTSPSFPEPSACWQLCLLDAGPSLPAEPAIWPPTAFGSPAFRFRNS